MADPTTTGTPTASGAGSGAPAGSPAPASPAAAPAAAAPQPSAPGGEGGRPAGSLPDDVHPAVAEERERAQQYRDLASQAFVFDDHGKVIGVRQEFVEQYTPRGGEAATIDADAQARQDRAIQTFAEEHGMLPEQVRGLIGLFEGMFRARFEEMASPLFETSIEGMKQSLIASGEVPAAAAPFIDKWVQEARRANPRATLTQKGRETILRQALGEYALSLLRARNRGRRPASPAANSPTLLRPTPAGGAGQVPVGEEATLRAKMGLNPTGYGAVGPKGAA